MTIVFEVHVGIDVSKDQLDVPVEGEKKCLTVAHSPKGIAKLVQQMHE